MADDQEQRTFEVIKLRIAFLQHITTLSGAAILIILALVERTETKKEAILLAATVSFFVIAAGTAVFGVVVLLMRTEHVGPDRPTAGSAATAMAGISFFTGIVTVAYFAAGGSYWLYGVITLTLGAFPLSLVLLRKPLSNLIRWYMIRHYDYDPYDPLHDYDPDATVRDANEDDAEQP